LQNQLHGCMGNREMNPLSLKNSSLEIVYCSTTLSSHGNIRLVRLLSKNK
jgi:hypothetical protein